MTNSKLIVLLSILAAALIVPFLVGWGNSNSEYIFGGFLLNPIDGNSYLAKMYIGWQGEWRFRLPYTLEAGEGAYLFLFYILLGHIARITGLPILVVFHLARLISAAILVYALLMLFRHSLKDKPPAQVQLTLILTVLGSGLGWVAVMLGGFTSDFWVAEAYPFLSMYSNPHFPLGLALLLLYFDWIISDNNEIVKAPLFTLLGLALAIIQPFAAVVGVIVSGLYILWRWHEVHKLNLIHAASFALGSGAFLLYQYLAILSDPVLSAWNEQNLTSAPVIWDLLVSFSPALLLSIVEVINLIKAKQVGRYKLFVSWLAAGIVLLYLPFNLQRRFILGFFVPCAFLGVAAIFQIAGDKMQLRKNFSALIVVLSVATNMIVLLGGLSGIANHDPLLYITSDEKASFDWMSGNFDETGPILASEQTGMYIPAYTGWRVVYGHPFETIQSEQRLEEINAIFDGDMSEEKIGQYILQNGIAYIFWGPREQMKLTGNPFCEYKIAYQNQTVTIYQTRVGQ